MVCVCVCVLLVLCYPRRPRQAYLIVLGRKGVKLNRTLLMPSNGVASPSSKSEPQDQRYPLRPGDIFVIAGRRFQFEYLEDDESSSIATPSAVCGMDAYKSEEVSNATTTVNANATTADWCEANNTNHSTASGLVSQHSVHVLQRAIIPPSPAPMSHRYVHVQPPTSTRRSSSGAIGHSAVGSASSQRNSSSSSSMSRRMGMGGGGGGGSRRMHLFPAESAPKELVEAFEVAQQQHQHRQQQQEEEKEGDSQRIGTGGAGAGAGERSEEEKENGGGLFAGLGSPRKPGSRGVARQTPMKNGNGGTPIKSTVASPARRRSSMGGGGDDVGSPMRPSPRQVRVRSTLGGAGGVMASTATATATQKEDLVFLEVLEEDEGEQVEMNQGVEVRSPRPPAGVSVVSSLSLHKNTLALTNSPISAVTGSLQRQRAHDASTAKEDAQSA